MTLADTNAGKMRAGLAGLLVLAILIVYSNTLKVPFLLDDFTTIPGNPSIKSLSPLSSVLFPPPEVYSAGRPVLNLSYALNHAFGGLALRGYHVVNLAIHVTAALLLFGSLRRAMMLPRLGTKLSQISTLLALLVTAAWALHPVQTVSVTYLSQRAESLMGLFYLLTIYGFIRSLKGRSSGWQMASVIACALGMATKEVMVTAPVLVFLLDSTCVTGSFRRTWSERWRYYAWLAATWLVLAALMISSELGKRGVGSEALTWYQYARLECVAVAKYLLLSLWPSPLVFDYGPTLPQPSWGQLILPALVVFGLAGWSLWQLGRCRVSGFVVFAFFLLLAPTSSVVPVAGQPMAENRMYLPLAVGLIAMMAGVFVLDRRTWMPYAAGVVGLGWMSHERNEDYGSAITLWRDTAYKQPVNQRAWVYFTEALKAEGKLNEAIAILLERLRVGPPSAELENNAAVALFSAGRVRESVEHFQTAIRLKPKYSDAYYNFGAVLFRIENFVPAMECFRLHLELKPDSVEGHNFAGLCLVRLGKFAEAIPHFERATALDPAHQHARTNLEFAKAQAAKAP